jgi:hypothetical protein
MPPNVRVILALGLALTATAPLSAFPQQAQPKSKLPPAGPPAVWSAEPVPVAPSRERLRRCASEWRDVKRRGADAGVTWRNFAIECYGRP